MKKFLMMQVLTSLVVLANAETTGGLAWTCAPSDGWKYLVEDGYAVITGLEVMDGDVIVPDVVDGYVVRKIATHSFYQNRSMTSLTIPATVGTMEPNAVSECRGLNGVYFAGYVPVGAADAFSSNASNLICYIPHDKLDDEQSNVGALQARWYLNGVDSLPIDDYDGSWSLIENVDGARCYQCRCTTDNWSIYKLNLDIFKCRVGYVKFKCRIDGQGKPSISDGESVRECGSEWEEHTVKLTGSSRQWNLDVTCSLRGKGTTCRFYIKDVTWLSPGEVRTATKWHCTLNGESVVYLDSLRIPHDGRYAWPSGWTDWKADLSYEVNAFSPVTAVMSPSGQYGGGTPLTVPGSGNMSIAEWSGSECWGYWLYGSVSLDGLIGCDGMSPVHVEVERFNPPTHSHYSIDFSAGKHGSFDQGYNPVCFGGMTCYGVNAYDFDLAAESLNVENGYCFAGWQMSSYDRHGYESYGSMGDSAEYVMHYVATYVLESNIATYTNTFGLVNPNPSEYTGTLELKPLQGTRSGYRFIGWRREDAPARCEIQTFSVPTDPYYNDYYEFQYVHYVLGDVIVEALWEAAPAFGETVGDRTRTWANEGDAEWCTAWDEMRGAWCVRSGEIGDNQTSTLETIVTNGGSVSFDVKVSCEGMQRGLRTDGLAILVDGEERVWLDGKVAWTNVTIAVSGEGEHRIKWKFSKDVEWAAGDDCAYLANFKFYHQVIVSFDSGGATLGGVPSAIVSYNGGTIVLPGKGALSKSKHSFAGWSDGVGLHQPGEQYVLGDISPIFTAVWYRKELQSPVITVLPYYETEQTTVEISAGEEMTIRYTIDGGDPLVDGIIYQGPFEVAGSITVRAVAVRDDWFDSAVVSASTVRAPWGYDECLNCNNVDFFSGGDSSWVRDLSVSHDGMASVRSGEIGNSQTNWLEAAVLGEGSLSFWWKASAEKWRGQFVDCGTLWVDGIEQKGLKIGDHDDWRQETVDIKGGVRHVIRWVYSKDVEDAFPFGWDDCVWLDQVQWIPLVPTIEGDADATVTGDAETGFVVRPSEGKTAVEVTIPQGVDAAKVTVEVSTKVASVKPNEAKVKVVSGGVDITEYLDIPGTVGCDGGGAVATQGDAVIDMTKATVKEEVVKEVLDPEKGAIIDLSGGSLGTTSPTITTAPTRVGLFYRFREGETLGGMKDGDSKAGDGQPWSPEIKVKGGNSAFYSIDVGKGE